MNDQNNERPTTHDLARDMLGAVERARQELGLPHPDTDKGLAARAVQAADALIKRLRGCK